MERKDFVRIGLAAAASGPFPANVSGASDRIRIGQIGCGGKIAAVADVYKPLVGGAVQLTGGNAQGCSDFRQDIDAVFVSTPGHWHAVASILACQAGHRVAAACHLAVIFYSMGRKIRWVSAKEEIIGDPEAQQLLTKPYRAPWLLPKGLICSI